MAGRLAGKVALVTGIGAGIGQGIGMMFAREGATVVGCDINPKTADATVEQITNEGFKISSFHPCDLTKPADAQRYVDFAIKQHGRIDILVNAAAIPPHMRKTAEMDYEKEWVPTMVGEVDLVFLLTKAAWPHLVNAGGGSIINFASVNAFRGSMNTGMVAHCAGKAAVLAMTRQLAIEGGTHNIRANSIAPGMVVTAATQAGGTSTDGPTKTNIMNRLLIKRLGQPEDIAYCALYLASDESTWVTGANFSIDGGVTAA